MGLRLPGAGGPEGKIKNSCRVAVPGCYASGFISIARPLVELGLAPADLCLRHLPEGVCRVEQPEAVLPLLQLLGQAIARAKGEPVRRDKSECLVDLRVDAFIPEKYIADGPGRIEAYKRIAAIQTAEDAADVLDELIDRYGEPPQPVLKLMDVALLRAEAVQIGVSDISQRGSEITFTFAASEAVPVEAVMALCSLPKNRRRLTLSATETEPKLLLRLTPNEDALDTALTLVGDLRVNKEENEKEVTL